MSKNNYDVIIVGGGPAGSTAGYLLNKIGLKILILDKARFPRNKLCGGLVSLKTIHLLNQIFDEPLSSLKQKGIFDRISNDYELNYKFEKVFAAKKSPIPFFFTKRKVFDDFLLSKVKKEGIEVYENARAKKIQLQNNTVILSSGEKLSARYIIGADGTNSVVRNELINNGIVSKRKWQDQLGTVLECKVKKKYLNHQEYDRMIISFGFVDWGYAFIFPHRDELYIGLGGDFKRNKGNFMTLFKNYLNFLKIPSDAYDKIEGMTCPFGNYDIKHTYDNKIILIGDAGGFIDPMFGEGLYFAHRTAQYAVFSIYHHIKSKRKIETSYENCLRTDVYPEMNMAKFIRKFWFSKFNTSTQYFFLGLIMKLLEKPVFEAVNGVRSYRLYNKKLNEQRILHT